MNFLLDVNVMVALGCNRTTDAHLLTLAEKHGLQLATLDTGILRAFLIPS